jgi:hypothetical protein
MIAAAEESLVLSTRVGELAEQYSLDAEDTEMQARLIQSAYGFSSEESAEIATRNQRMNRGVKTLVDNFKTWN